MAKLNEAIESAVFVQCLFLILNVAQPKITWLYKTKLALRYSYNSDFFYDWLNSISSDFRKSCNWHLHNH